MKSPADCKCPHGRVGQCAPCAYHQGVRDGAAEERADVIAFFHAMVATRSVFVGSQSELLASLRKSIEDKMHAGMGAKYAAEQATFDATIHALEWDPEKGEGE